MAAFAEYPAGTTYCQGELSFVGLIPIRLYSERPRHCEQKNQQLEQQAYKPGSATHCP